jgi:hypothetical protein
LRVSREKAQEAKKNNPSYEAADGLFSSSPTFDLSSPFYVLLRLLRIFAAKKPAGSQITV